ncbi:MAG TPA: PQQ-binding-like beta-propeller repeat protein [Pirellulales bacterium]|jgi:outer membrane protein assembly factor BamB|nr:PQQ-binding-like beta-propeller repeat protein [Pirellulales bacterium]
MRIAVLFLIGTLSVAVTSAAENWPQFRGPNGDGRSAGTGLPVTWSESEHVAWKTAIHGKGWSSPVIWDNQIWMTTAPEDGKQLYAVCVDRETGRIVHDVRVFEIAQPQYCYPLNSYATPTPVVEEGRVYVHFGTHGTAALDTQSGKILWTRQDFPCNHHRGPASSPIVFGNLLVVAYDGFDLQYVVALDKRTGKTVWRRDRNIDYGTEDGDAKKAYGTGRVIEVEGKPQLVYPSAGATIAYEPQTGEEIWRVRHGGMNANATPLFGNGRLYLNTASGGFKLFAMRVGGSGDLTETNVEWKCSQGVPSRSSEVLVGDLIFMTSEAGVASCLDAKTGKAIRQQRLKGEFSSSALFADGRIYSSNQDGSTFVLSADREFKLLATNVLDAGCMASPAVYGKALYVRTKTHLYRIQQ